MLSKVIVIGAFWNPLGLFLRTVALTKVQAVCKLFLSGLWICLSPTVSTGSKIQMFTPSHSVCQLLSSTCHRERELGMDVSDPGKSVLPKQWIWQTEACLLTLATSKFALHFPLSLFFPFPISRQNVSRQTHRKLHDSLDAYVQFCHDRFVSQLKLLFTTHSAKLSLSCLPVCNASILLILRNMLKTFHSSQTKFTNQKQLTRKDSALPLKNMQVQCSKSL